MTTKRDLSGLTREQLETNIHLLEMSQSALIAQRKRRWDRMKSMRRRLQARIDQLEAMLPGGSNSIAPSPERSAELMADWGTRHAPPLDQRQH